MGQCNMIDKGNGERPFDYVQCDYENHKNILKKQQPLSKFKSSTATAVYMYRIHDF